jgi:hypothetical protein
LASWKRRQERKELRVRRYVDRELAGIALQIRLYTDMMAYAVQDAQFVISTMGFDDMDAERVLGQLANVRLKGLINEPGVLSFKEYAEEEFGSLQGFNPIDWMLQNPTEPLEMQEHDGS